MTTETTPGNEVAIRAKLGLPVTVECPECGNHGTHDTNGDREDPSMVCNNCGMLTDADHFEVD